MRVSRQICALSTVWCSYFFWPEQSTAFTRKIVACSLHCLQFGAGLLLEDLWSALSAVCPGLALSLGLGGLLEGAAKRHSLASILHRMRIAVSLFWRSMYHEGLATPVFSFHHPLCQPEPLLRLDR